MDCLKPFRLGDWGVDPITNAFERGAERVQVEPKAMQVLAVLVEHAGVVVPKDVLLERVWEGRFVTDDVLIGAIGQLRRALGDSARSPTFIQTVPRRGYRLVADVVAASPAKPFPAEPAQPVRRSWRSAPGARLAVASALALAFVASGLVASWSQAMRHDGDGRAVATAAEDTVESPGARERHPDALVAYQRARLLMKRETETDPKQALDDLRRAVELDPDFAEAWVLLSKAHSASRDFGVPAEVAAAEERRAARRALALAPESAEVQLRMAQLHLFQDRDFEAARISLDRAMALEPTHAASRRYSGALHSILGEFDAALAVALEARRLDPANEPTGFEERLRFMAGERDAAIDDLKELQTARPEAYFLRLVLFELLRAEGRDAEAFEQLRTLYLRNGSPERWAELRVAFDEAGFERVDRMLLDELLSDRQAGKVPRRPIVVAEVAIWAGDLDLAFRELNQRVDAGDSEVLYLHTRPLFTALRGDPRYEDLLARLGLPEPADLPEPAGLPHTP